MKVDWSKKVKVQCPRCGSVNLNLMWNNNSSYSSILYEEYECCDCSCKFEAIFKLDELRELEEGE